MASLRISTTRAKSARAWLLIVLYLAIGFGGAWLFSRAVSDSEWRELFYMVWWIPSGLAAAWLSGATSAWITACPPENSTEL